MVTVNDDTMSKLNGLTDDDGKIIVTDDMPDDLKAAINYLNDNNISLFSGPDPQAYVEDYEPDPFAPDYVDDSSDIESDLDEELEDDEEDDLEEDDETSVEGLDDIF